MHLHPLFPANEFRLTLRTPSATVAKTLAQHLNACLQTSFTRIQQMTDDEARAEGRLLLGDLTERRDRLIADLAIVARDAKSIDARKGAVEARIHSVIAQIGLIRSSLPAPGDVATPDSLSRLEAAHRELQTLDDELRAAQPALFALGKVEDAAIETAQRTLEGIQQVSYSAQHQKALGAEQAGFERRKQDMQEMMAIVAASAQADRKPT